MQSKLGWFPSFAFFKRWKSIGNAQVFLSIKELEKAPCAKLCGLDGRLGLLAHAVTSHVIELG
jgi:hypothetical protein